VRGTLASYIALGARGCRVGDVTFADFSYSSPGADISADGVLVYPSIPSLPSPRPPPAPGFTFRGTWIAKAGQTATVVIAYTATPAGWSTDAITPLPAGKLTLKLGAAQIFDIFGSVAVEEETSVGALSVYETCREVCILKEADELVYSPVQPIKIANTLTVVGGNGGALLSGFSQTVGPADFPY
jgi:hypothetical protein